MQAKRNRPDRHRRAIQKISPRDLAVHPQFPVS
jgi:hypothetical protein